MKHTKKKKRSRPPKQANGTKNVVPKEDNEEMRVLNSLMEAFALVSMEETAAAYKEANGDPDKAAEIIGGFSDDRAMSCSSSSGSSSLGSTSSSEMYAESKCGLDNWVKGKPKKKLVAATGMVSTVLGKDYVRSKPRKESTRGKCFNDSAGSKEETEQFLCSMLGDESELNMAVVRDVLCQCKYDVEKAMNVLLEFSASSTQPSSNGRCTDDSANIREDSASLIGSDDCLTDRSSDSTSHSSESELQDNVWSMGYNRRNYFEVLVGSEAHLSTSSKVSESELPQKVLEYLFNTPRSSEHKPSTMNWRNMVKKMEALGQSSQVCTSRDEEPKPHADGEEYRVCRESARQQWDLMRSYYQKAATAYTNGERDYAVYLSEQGRVHNKKALEADEKASQDIFQARNKSIENMITIDLHGQHVKQAMKLLKHHLLFGAYVRSVRWFKVITGCGSHGLGKSKLKQSVIDLVQKEGIQWGEENRGTLLIRLDGQTGFSFLDTDSDTE